MRKTKTKKVEKKDGKDTSKIMAPLSVATTVVIVQNGQQKKE